MAALTPALRSAIAVGLAEVAGETPRRLRLSTAPADLLGARLRFVAQFGRAARARLLEARLRVRIADGWQIETLDFLYTAETLLEVAGTLARAAPSDAAPDLN